MTPDGVKSHIYCWFQDKKYFSYVDLLFSFPICEVSSLNTHATFIITLKRIYHFYRIPDMQQRQIMIKKMIKIYMSYIAFYYILEAFIT